MQNFHKGGLEVQGCRYLTKALSLCRYKMVLIFPILVKATVRPRIALVTSGIGTKHGGIGVVADLIVSALEKDSDMAVWEHHAFWPRLARIPAAVGRAFLGSLKTPDFVLYDHVDLAILHAVIPV